MKKACLDEDELADLEAVALTGDPAGLARAIELIEMAQKRIASSAFPGAARIRLPRLLSSHPDPKDRAPSQELLVIRQNHETGERSLDLLKWGIVPSWSSDPKGGPKPINAMAETVRSKPMFREAYHKRRCIVPVDGFFEWQATSSPMRLR